MFDGKYVVHLRAPVLSQSGYGAHAREITDFLLEDGRFILALENIPWGECAYVHNEPNMELYYKCISNFVEAQSKNIPFDLSIQVTIPNEFSRTAAINIGVTAGIEVDRCTFDWMQKCNEMDYIVVPSEFSKKVLEKTVADWTNKDTGQKGKYGIHKPIYVIPQWFKDFEARENSPVSKISFDTKFNFLNIAQWGGKGVTFGEDRKNIGNLVKIFYETFKENKDVGLVLKLNIVNNTNEDFEHVKNRLAQIKKNFPGAKCKLYLIHDSLDDNDIFDLYRHRQVDAFVSLTCGEGFGRPLLEAAAAGLPVIATDWSGHKDFLNKGKGFLPVEYELKDVPKCQIWPGVIEDGAQWANVKEEHAKRVLRKFVSSSKPIKDQAKNNSQWIKENYSKESIVEKWNSFFNKVVFKEENEVVDVETIQRNSNKNQAVDKLKSMVKESDKEKVLYIMPRSTGDVLMSTAIVDALITSRHQDSDFYFATLPQYKELLEEFEGINVIDYVDEMMMTDLTSEVWDVVYNPTINVQYNFSNWRLGNGLYAAPLLGEFAKHCNLHPGTIKDYKVKLKECTLPEGPYITFTPGGNVPAKTYAHWDDVIKNLKEMFPGVKIAQTGLKNEKLFDGVLDYRGQNARETMYLIKNAVLHVSIDTFTAHAAAAVGTDYVTLYGCTDTTVKPVVLGAKGTLGLLIETSERGDHPKSAACFKDDCKTRINGFNTLSQIDPKSVCNMIYEFCKQRHSQQQEEAAE